MYKKEERKKNDFAERVGSVQINNRRVHPIDSHTTNIIISTSPVELQ